MPFRKYSFLLTKITVPTARWGHQGWKKNADQPRKRAETSDSTNSHTESPFRPDFEPLLGELSASLVNKRPLRSSISFTSNLHVYAMMRVAVLRLCGNRSGLMRAPFSRLDIPRIPGKTKWGRGLFSECVRGGRIFIIKWGNQDFIAELFQNKGEEATKKLFVKNLFCREWELRRMLSNMLKSSFFRQFVSLWMIIEYSCLS